MLALPKPIIAPSLLSADFGHLADAIQWLNASQADWIHVDVMDGVFVPNISFGFPVMSVLKAQAAKPLDVHLMIVQPERYVQQFADHGADILTVHYEACTHLDRTLHAIKDAGMQAGVSLNPSTPVDVLRDVLHLADLVLIMSVNPGFGGQRFIENTYRKLARLRQLMDETGTNPVVEVDGGVNAENAPLLVKAGARALVAGNFIFAAQDREAAVASLHSANIQHLNA